MVIYSEYILSDDQLADQQKKCAAYDANRELLRKQMLEQYTRVPDTLSSHAFSCDGFVATDIDAIDSKSPDTDTDTEEHNVYLAADEINERRKRGVELETMQEEHTEEVEEDQSTTSAVSAESVPTPVSGTVQAQQSYGGRTQPKARVSYGTLAKQYLEMLHRVLEDIISKIEDPNIRDFIRHDKGVRHPPPRQAISAAVIKVLKSNGLYIQLIDEMFVLCATDPTGRGKYIASGRCMLGTESVFQRLGAPQCTDVTVLITSEESADIVNQLFTGIRRSTNGHSAAMQGFVHNVWKVLKGLDPGILAQLTLLDNLGPCWKHMYAVAYWCRDAELLSQLLNITGEYAGRLADTSFRGNLHIQQILDDMLLFHIPSNMLPQLFITTLTAYIVPAVQNLRSHSKTAKPILHLLKKFATFESNIRQWAMTHGYLTRNGQQLFFTHQWLAVAS